MKIKSSPRSQAFSIFELTAAMCILGIVMIIIAQTAFWSYQQRHRVLANHAALEQAENILEQARAIPAEDLTAEWAKERRLLKADDLPTDAALTVKVEPYAETLKRVQVTVTWDTADAPRSVELMGIFGNSKQGAKK